MNIRVKFSKTGSMKFIGHLDIMRYFQKAIRRAEIDIAFSGGFSPHMIMSFAAPLGVGITSSGEYFDMEVNSTYSSEESLRRLNEVMVEGIEVLSYRKVPEGKASKAMSLVAAADYLVTFRPGKEPVQDWKTKLAEFYSQDSITVWKKTKKSEKEMDIRPFIYQLFLQGDAVFMQLAAGSTSNTKPELVMEAFAAYAGIAMDEFAYTVHRLEVYANTGTKEKPVWTPLEGLGEEIE